MKSTFKRIIALAIVLCTLGAMMIPGVSVSAETATTTTYSLPSLKTAAGGTGWIHLPTYATYKSAKAAYEDSANALNFMLDSVSIKQAKFASKFGVWSFWPQVSGNADHTTGYIAFRLWAPSAGDFTLSAEYGASNTEVTIRNAGAYIIEAPAEHYDYGTGAGSLGEAMATKVQNGLTPVLEFEPYDKDTDLALKTEPGTLTTELKANTEYLVVFYMTNGSDYDLDSSLNAEMYLKSFSLTKVEKPTPEATIQGKDVEGDFATVKAAAVNGDTIVLGKDVTVEGELDLAEGVTLDLNGKTLAVDYISGNVIDTADGDGLLAVASEKALITTGEQVALWDSAASGYRIFEYTFTTYEAEDGENNVPTELHASYVPFEYANEKCGASCNHVLTDHAEAIKNAFEDNLNWRFEATSFLSTFKPSGGSSFSSGEHSLRFQGTKGVWMALRLKAPGDGWAKINIKHGSRASNGATADVYLIPASTIEAKFDDYAVSAEELSKNIYQDGKQTDLFNEFNNAISEELTAENYVMQSVTDAGNNVTTGEYTFQAGEDYIIVFKVTDGSYVYIDEISFDRYAQVGATKTFWSSLKFNESDAYTLVARGDSGLSTGFEMTLNDGAPRPFYLSNVKEWAAEQALDTARNLGFYIRVSGFEALDEGGELTAKPFFKTKLNAIDGKKVTEAFEIN